MNAAIICGGSSVLDHDFSVRRHDVIVAVNHMGERVHCDHWAALDSHRPRFWIECPSWKMVDWDEDALRAGRSLEIKPGVRFTLPHALDMLVEEYDPDEIDLYGVDMEGARVDGVVAPNNRWKDEEEQLLQLDLSRCNWHGLWLPPLEQALESDL